MAFRRPGIRVLERDAGGDPITAVVVPFSERVVATVEGPTLLEEFRRLPAVERQRLQPVTRVTPAPVTLPTPVRPPAPVVEVAPVEELAPIEPDTNGAIFASPQGFWSNRDRPGVVIPGRRDSPPDRSIGWVWSVIPPGAGDASFRPIDGFTPRRPIGDGTTTKLDTPEDIARVSRRAAEAERRGLRRGTAAWDAFMRGDPIETMEEKEIEEVSIIAPPTEPPVGIEPVIELPAEDGAGPSDGTSPGAGRNGDGGVPLVGVGGGGGFGGSGGGATVNVEAPPAGAPPVAGGAGLPRGAIVALGAVGLLVAGAVAVGAARKGK